MARRKTFVAREDLLRKVKEMAKRRGYTIYDMVNAIFEVAIKAEASGIDIDRVIEEGAILKRAKEVGFALVPESLWREMVELVYERAGEEVSKMWFEAGFWLGKRYATGDYEDPLSVFKRDLEAFAMDSYELDLERAEDLLRVSVASSSFSEPHAFLFSRFLEGALKAFGYEVVRREVLKGLIKMEARRSLHG
jgi:hypothetical protein